VRNLTLTVIGFIATHAYSADLNPREVVAKSISNYQNDSNAALDFTYTERDVTKDTLGNPKTTDVSQVFVVDGTPYSRLIGKNGHTLDPEETAREIQKYQKALVSREKETPEQRTRRLHKYQEQWQFLNEIPDAFNAQLLGHETIAGRVNYIVELTPRPGYVSQSKNARIFHDIRGKLWIDHEDLRWTKAEAEVTDTISMGWILARIGPGAHITIKQVRVEGPHWMPAELDINGSAKIMLVKNRAIDETVTYSDYKRIVASPGTAAAKNR
jgi:hypothetical protein